MVYGYDSNMWGVIMTESAEIIDHVKWKILRILYGKSVGKQIAKLVNFAHEHNANGRSVGKHWQRFLGYKLIYLRFKYGKRAVDDISNKITEEIKEEKIPNNQEIKRLIDSTYPDAALDFKAYMVR
jgi:hypothetical protein